MPPSDRFSRAVRTTRGGRRPQYTALDVSQKLIAICFVHKTGHRLWRGQCATDQGEIERTVSGVRERMQELASRPAL